MSSIKGLTGRVGQQRAADTSAYRDGERDVSLRQMAEWAFNYLIRSPKPEYNYQPVFQVFPLRPVSVREGYDPVVDCDTDARMDWEWYYMRDIVGDERGREEEERFHRRMRGFVSEKGFAVAHGGCYREDLEDAVYGEEDRIIHVWGTTKILRSLSEEFLRTGNAERLELAGRMYRALKNLYIWGEDEIGPWCHAPNGMGPVQLDGTVNKVGWSAQPNQIVGSLLTYYRASGDEDAMGFAKAAARGIMDGRQPGAVRFYADGSFGTSNEGEFWHTILGSNGSVGHSHATLHALWGIAELGLATGERRYMEFAKRSFDWMMSRGTGTGWFPAMPDNCNETCAISDMISIAALLGRAGYAEYFDYAERFFRNYIVNLQFALTPEMKAYYRRIHADRPIGEVERQLELLARVQGAIIGGSGINDYENDLLGRVSGFSIFGCCAPEGMRAIHTVWQSAAVHESGSCQHGSHFLPEGLYINMGFNLENEHVLLESLLPRRGGMRVLPKNDGKLYLRPAHWADSETVRLRVNGREQPIRWVGSGYAELDTRQGDEAVLEWPLIAFEHTSSVWPVTAPDLEVTFTWEGNRVIASDPPAAKGSIPLFSRSIRTLPQELPYKF